MNFNLSEEHKMIRDAARDFAQTELLPGVIERDNKQEFPNELVKKMGELGFMGIMVDPAYGGSGMDATSYVLVMEELSKIDASASVIVSVNNSLYQYFAVNINSFALSPANNILCSLLLLLSAFFIVAIVGLESLLYTFPRVVNNYFNY